MEHNKLLAVRDLRFSYEKNKEILHGITTAFTPGRITALLGANGCGKSTLLNLLAGIHKPDGGAILLDGKDLSGWKRAELAKRIAVVHQSNFAPGDMTVEKLISAGRTPYRERFKGLTDRDMDAVRRAMEDTDTAMLADRQIGTLSGGQLQRVWLAMALAQETDILMLDEFTTYMDIHYQLELLHLIAELNRKKNLTVIAVLHDINQAVKFCHEAVVMKSGQILAQGTVTEAIRSAVLEEAFQVSAYLLTVNGKQHCIFERKANQTYA